jgi:acyl-CoA hydrolase
MNPIIFGGKFMSELDLCAAKCVRRFLYDSTTADGSVTYKMDVTFKAPCYQGDLIFIEAEIVDTGEKSISVSVKAFREQKVFRRTRDPLHSDNSYQERVEVAEANFVFISIKVDEEHIQTKPYFLPYVKHGLSL